MSKYSIEKKIMSDNLEGVGISINSLSRWGYGIYVRVLWI